ncbi:MAG TPA: ABC transporter permease subunit, partial [Candidatus Limnocylindria bacterium]|nr:ABC transporter permease subunit [Candidatus Limnocylindria bacterium]
GAFARLSLLREFEARRETFFAHTARHLTLALSAAGAAAVLGVLLSFLLLRFRRLEAPAVFAVNLAQTVPTLSLLGLLLALLVFLGREGGLLGGLGISGVGFLPAWIALVLYALYPVLNSALAGLRMADPAALDAARAMGMGARQAFFRVQLPLALPLILGGVRTAVTQSMGNAVLAALIGGGGLGSLIFLGLAQSAADLVLLGVVPLIALTFAADAALKYLERISLRRAGHDPGGIADQNL